VPARGRGRLVDLAAPAAGGVLYFLGYVGWGVWPCLLVFLVPLWGALERAEGWRAAAGAGLAFGVAAYVGGFLWLWRLVAIFLDGNRAFGAVLWLAYGAWFAVGFAVYAVLFHGVRRRGWPVAVAGVAPLVAVEWLQPQLFPLYAGNGLVAAPTWAQLADVGGPLLLTALLGVVNVGVLAAWEWWRGRGRPATALAAAAVVAGALVYGRVRMAGVDREVAAAPGLTVGVVQANLGVLEKTALSLVTHERHLEDTRALLASGPVDLVVWPETAYVRGIRRPLPVSGRPILDDLSVPLLFGGSSVEERDGRRRKANSAFLVGADGMIRDAYDKNLLIPLAEYVPLAGIAPALARWFPHVDDFAAATGVPALRLGGWRIATPICYEAIRPELVRRMVRESRPHLLVTLANDAWFGDSQEPWLHLALARLRAVEHRRFLVRATNSGVSAVVDPAGRIVARTGLLTRETLRATVRPLDGETVYAKFGDWPGWIAAAVVVAAFAARRRVCYRPPP
jgi:apolipoprotein N-acyltransferase